MDEEGPLNLQGDTCHEWERQIMSSDLGRWGVCACVHVRVCAGRGCRGHAEW